MRGFRYTYLAMSTAGLVRERVDSTPSRGFLAVRDVPGSRRAVETAFSRMAAEGLLVHVRRGLYWKGPRTRFGMPLPRTSELSLALAGPGGGPAGVTAARALGLTTQVPAIDFYAVPGRIPTPPPGVKFVSRSIERRIHELTAMEVALLEVLRDWPGTVEGTWADLVSVARRLADAGEVRIVDLDGHIESEAHRGLRLRWSTLAEDL